MTAPSPPQPLVVRVFGSSSISCGGEPIPKMRTRKETWLLALLLLQAVDNPLERSSLAGMLWPEAPQAGALHNLRRSLGVLRQALGTESERIFAPTPRSLQIDPAGAFCDVLAFDAAIRRGDPESLAEAVALYRGPLLQDCQEEWIVHERETRGLSVLRALETLAEQSRETGDLPGAEKYLRRALELDPLRETALRSLLTTLASQGRHAAAGEAYRVFRQRLHREMNAVPDPETVELSRQIQTEGRAAASAQVRKAAPSAPPKSQNLPQPLTRLIGRETEREAVVAQIDAARMVTLTGMGGSGKTRLSLAVAESISADFVDGVCFVDFSPLSDPELLPSYVNAALGLRESRGSEPAIQLRDFLRSKRFLLVLDNCEHLVAGCARLARTLLHECPHIRILSTSREPLHVPGEVVWAVPNLEPREAVQLFDERATQASFAFQLTAANSDAVARICTQLDGIPLAIEMAAARTRVMPVVQIALRLDNAFRLLTAGPSGDTPRHGTLRATFDWSYDLLTDQERMLLTQLSVFAGGWTLEAAEAVCFEGENESIDVLDLLASLVDKSLVIFVEDSSGEGRYRLLETIRQYGQEKLRLLNQDAATRSRHADYFRKMADDSAEILMGPQQYRGLALLEKEQDNFRTALRWYEDEAAGGSNGLSGVLLVRSLMRFWMYTSRLTEARDWAGRALRNSEGRLSGADATWRQKLLNDAAVFAQSQGDISAARGLISEALAISEANNDARAMALARTLLGTMAESQGDYENSRRLYGQVYDYWRTTDNKGEIASSLSNLAIPLYLLGDLDTAYAMQLEALKLRREVGEPRLIAVSLHNLGALEQFRDNNESARTFHEEALAIRRLGGEPVAIASSLANLGQVLFAFGRVADWKSMVTESLELRRKAGDQRGIARCQTDLGRIATIEGDFALASSLFAESIRTLCDTDDRRGLITGLIWIIAAFIADGASTPELLTRNACLFGAVEALITAAGPVLSVSQRRNWDSIRSQLTSRLGEEVFAAASEQGRTLTIDQTLKHALQLLAV